MLLTKCAVVMQPVQKLECTVLCNILCTNKSFDKSRTKSQLQIYSSAILPQCAVNDIKQYSFTHS